MPLFYVLCYVMHALSMGSFTDTQMMCELDCLGLGFRV